MLSYIVPGFGSIQKDKITFPKFVNEAILSKRLPPGLFKLKNKKMAVEPFWRSTVVA